DPRRNAARTVGVARPHACAETELRLVRELHGLVLSAERPHRDDGPDDPLARDPPRRIPAGQYRRLVEPAGEVEGGTATSYDGFGAALPRLRDEVLHLRPLLLGDPRPG